MKQETERTVTVDKYNKTKGPEVSRTNHSEKQRSTVDPVQQVSYGS